MFFKWKAIDCGSYIAALGYQGSVDALIRDDVQTLMATQVKMEGMMDTLKANSSL